MTTFVVVDLEATCWEKGTRPQRMEIIEWGAVRLEPPRWDVWDEFQMFVKPTDEPELSEFCRTLTGITQRDVDGAGCFPLTLAWFLSWTGPAPFRWGSWGAYDLAQIRYECERHSLWFPEAMNSHVNLKKLYAETRGIRPCGMKRALEREGLALEGSHHRALDDARNIAALARLLLPGPGTAEGSE